LFDFDLPQKAGAKYTGPAGPVIPLAY